MSELLETLRMEKKYLLNLSEMYSLNRVLSRVLREDAHNGAEGYAVRSLYFDTPDNSDFRDKADGCEMRRKIRLRIYDTGAQTAKLELKEKQGELQRKRSLIMARAQAQAMCSGDYTPLLSMNTDFSLELYGRMKQYCYRPKCIVEYDRKAFILPENSTRITLDSNLRATEAAYDLYSAKLNLYPVGIAHSCTLEVKYSRFLLSYIKDLVSLTGRTQTSVSKYCAARYVSMGGEE